MIKFRLPPPESIVFLSTIRSQTFYSVCVPVHICRVMGLYVLKDFIILSFSG